MIRRFLLICSLALFAVACNNSPADSNSAEAATDITALKKDVIAKHDTAMARMNEIAALQKKLKQEISPEDSLEFMDVYGQLQNAREGMMTWMREFDVPSDSSEAGQLRYLKGEYDRISEVDENMLTAIAKAEILLEEKALN